MAKIKLFTLLICSFLLQAASFTANAQCSNVAISATSTPATCYNDGTITVTVSGANVNNIALDSAEFRLTPNPTGNFVDWTPTWTSSGATKIYNQAVSGIYRLEMRAFCKISQNWTTHSIATDVTVGGNYTPLVISAITSRKSMSCRPTGEIQMNLTSGKAPYNVIVTAPPGFTGSTNFSTSNPTYTFSNTPAGVMFHLSLFSVNIWYLVKYNREKIREKYHLEMVSSKTGLKTAKKQKCFRVMFHLSLFACNQQEQKDLWNVPAAVKPA